VAIFDAIGSILSRIFKFKYVWLTFGSILIYGLTCYYLVKHNNLIIGAVGNFLVGAFDAIVGSYISKKLQANIPEEDLINLKVTPKLVITVGMFSCVVGYITVLLFT